MEDRSTSRRRGVNRRALLRTTGLTLAAGPLMRGAAAQAQAHASGTVLADSGTFAFTHPGVLHLREDLDRMRAAVAAQQDPIYLGYQALAADSRSSASYPIQNTGQITTWGRGPSNWFSQAVSDADAAYQNALMWYITGDDGHGDHARDILDVWAGSLTALTGADAELGAGLQCFKLVNAAEILRQGGYGRWPAADITRCERSFLDVWYPAISGYALFANGNWDVIAAQAIAGVGVFADNRTLFDDAMRFAASGAGNGSVLHRIVTAAGQGQESGRDQGHEQLALGILCDVAQVAWNHGVDLYAYADHRLLANAEYDASYNLGGNVPFTPALDRTGKYLKTAVSATNRGKLLPVYEMIYAHYASQLGLDAPNTKAVLFRGTGGTRFAEGNDDDTPSWGTLTFARLSNGAPGTPAALPGAPSGLTAAGTAAAVTLSWIASAEPRSAAAATGYTVRRSVDGPDGPYQTIATEVAETTWSDRAVRAGRGYHYTVTSSNAVGESPVSAPASAAAGLPGAWTALDVGEVNAAGSTHFDGERFTVEAGGADIAGTADAFHFVQLPLQGNGSITARVVDPVSSQYAKVGVMMRDSTTPNAAHAAMLIQGLPLVAWSGVWTTRAVPGGATSATGSTPVPPSQLDAITVNAAFPLSALGSLPASATPLAAPYVEGAGDGYRLRMPYWVRIERRDSVYTGSISADGAQWTQVGSATLPLGDSLQIGLAATSCLGVAEPWAQTGTCAFDNVTVRSATGVWTAPAPAGTPSELAADATSSAIELTWNDQDLSGRFTVWRADQPAGIYWVLATDVGPVGFGARSRYVDATAQPGRTYYYTVAKTNTGGEGPRSAPVSATMPTPPAPRLANTGTAYANRGVPFALLLRGTNDPARFAADGLPHGLRLTPTTGLISGIPTSAGTTVVSVTAVNAAGQGTGKLTLEVGTPPPSPWSYTDIGDVVPDERQLGIFGVSHVQTPGNTSYDAASAAFTVRGAGSDLNVNGQGMTGHVATRQVSGDMTITARVNGFAFSGALASAQLGLIMAKSLTPFDQMAAAIITGAGGGWIEQLLARKLVAGSAATSSGATGTAATLWLRLQRSGTTFAASASPDGATWTVFAQDTVPAFGDAPYQVGFVVCSRAATVLATAVFDNVSISEP
jgi:regulation of enolase protein 1 (concanavalin A-like superfamily)